MNPNVTMNESTAVSEASPNTRWPSKGTTPRSMPTIEPTKAFTTGLSSTSEWLSWTPTNPPPEPLASAELTPLPLLGRRVPRATPPGPVMRWVPVTPLSKSMRRSLLPLAAPRTTVRTVK